MGHLHVYVYNIQRLANKNTMSYWVAIPGKKSCPRNEQFSGHSKFSTKP